MVTVVEKLTWRGSKIVLPAILGAALAACTVPQAQRPPPLDGAAQAVMEGTTQQVLEENLDGQGSNWSIAESGHAGSVIPTRTFKTETGQTCREFQQTVTVGGATRVANGTACRKTEGGWQRIDYSGLADIRAYRRPYPAYGYPPYGYGPYYGYRPYYPRASFGVFFGHGHHYRHRHHHRYRHYKKHHGGHGGRRHPDR